MSIGTVEAAIRRVRKQLADYDRDNYGWSYNETATRYILIDPVLRALGWDIYDLDQCSVEWAMPPDKPIGRADYVLGNSLDENVIVIEAKRMDVAVGGEPRGFENKLAGYTKGMSTGVAVLTNGLVWRLYELDSTRRALRNRRTDRADIGEGHGTISGCARTLDEWLDKDRWW